MGSRRYVPGSGWEDLGAPDPSFDDAPVDVETFDLRGDAGETHGDRDVADVAAQDETGPDVGDDSGSDGDVSATTTGGIVTDSTSTRKPKTRTKPARTSPAA